MSHRHCGNCWMEMDVSSGPLCDACRIKEDITKTLERIQAPPEEEEEGEDGSKFSLLRRLWS